MVFLDASAEYKDDKNQNTLTTENIAKVIDAHTLGTGTSVPEKSETEVSPPVIDKFMRVVDMAEIKKNDYNLNISRYIDTSEDEVIVDIGAIRNEITELESKESAIDEKLNAYLKALGL